jgi:hypothetical protein
MTATLRYELRMQLRRGATWTVTGVMLLLLWLFVHTRLSVFLAEPPRVAMTRATIALDVPLPVGYAFLLADRLVRDEWLGMSALLHTTPSARWKRLLGKYFGAAAVTALPIAAVYFGFAGWYAVRNSAPHALLWALAAFGSITLPALLFVGALALCCPLLMPTTVFRVLFVAYWIWTSYLIPPRLVPTLTATVIYPMGGYPIQVFFGYHNGHAGGEADWAGPVPGALFNVLRPAPNQATAWLSIAILLALTALCLAAAHLIDERRHR